jgi:hypothetical protein
MLAHVGLMLPQAVTLKEFNPQARREGTCTWTAKCMNGSDRIWYRYAAGREGEEGRADDGTAILEP